MNHINPDLSALKRHGSKLLQYHGWNDPAISPLNSVNYFESVQKKMGDNGEFYRLFMVPGMAHCVGGPGPKPVRQDECNRGLGGESQSSGEDCRGPYAAAVPLSEGREV